MGVYEKSTDVNQIAAVYEKYRENPEKLTTEQLAEALDEIAEAFDALLVLIKVRRNELILSLAIAKK